MKDITLEELLEAGSHFGHQVTRHNPKAREFIFEARDNIHIIDLAKTKQGLEEAAAFVKHTAKKAADTTILVVATKRQAKAVIEDLLKEKGMSSANGVFFVTNRWVGGILTNHAEVAKNCRKLKDISELLQNPDEQDRYTKKELGKFAKEKQKLESFYDGIKDMKARPDVLYVVDAHLEHLAVREARATHVPTVAMVDTNADPNLIDFPIPANDDAVGSVKIISTYILDAWLEGKEEGAKVAAAEAANAEKAKETAEKKVEEVEKPANAKKPAESKEKSKAKTQKSKVQVKS